VSQEFSGQSVICGDPHNRLYQGSMAAKTDASASSKGDGLQTSKGGRFIMVEVPDADEKAPTEAPKPARVQMSRAVATVLSSRGSKTVQSRMVQSVGLTSSAGGTLYSVTNLYTSLLANGEFTNFQALFREFRIVAVKFHFLPFTPYKVEASTNTNGRPIAFCVDPENASTPSSFIQVFDNANATCCVSQDTHRWHWKNKDKSWYSTFSTTNPLQPDLSIKVGADSNVGATIPVGALILEMFVDYGARL